MPGLVVRRTMPQTLRTGSAAEQRPSGGARGDARRVICGRLDAELSRREFLERSGLAALSAAGVYALLDGVAAPPARAATGTVSPPPEQHIMRGLRVIVDSGVAVLAPPLHHQVVTANLRVGRGKRALAAARAELEEALRTIERRLPPTPAGLGMIVGWGAPYFREYVPSAGGRRFPAYLPIDRQASTRAGAPVAALLDAEAFPSDPERLVLEENDVVVVLQSDSLAHIADAGRAIFSGLAGMFELTSIRKGFVGGGFDGRTSLPKEMATRAGVPGADLIPEHAQLFLGFTSTQRSALGPDRIANFETLPGLTDQWPRGYFRNGTTLHLSHLFEDVQLWYQTSDFTQRVWLATDASRAANNVLEGTLTLPEGPADVQTEELVERFAPDAESGLVGHSASMQPVNRVQQTLRDNYGTLRPAGTSILQRIDFNTLDNPFFWTSRPRDRHSDEPSPGLHFLAFSPTSDLFRQMRLAMDGRFPDGATLPLPPTSPRLGLNGVIHATHRQNFLVPPRRRRSFPLSELL